MDAGSGDAIACDSPPVDVAAVVLSARFVPLSAGATGAEGALTAPAFRSAFALACAADFVGGFAAGLAAGFVAGFAAGAG